VSDTPFDIFRGVPGKDAKWLESAATFDVAQQRMKQISAQQPGTVRRGPVLGTPLDRNPATRWNQGLAGSKARPTGNPSFSPSASLIASLSYPALAKARPRGALRVGSVGPSPAPVIFPSAQAAHVNDHRDNQNQKV